MMLTTHCHCDIGSVNAQGRAISLTLRVAHTVVSRRMQLRVGQLCIMRLRLCCVDAKSQGSRSQAASRWAVVATVTSRLHRKLERIRRRR